MKINLKKPNHNYPSCLNVSCDHHALYSLGEVRVSDFEIWPVIDYRDQHMTANAWEDIGKELKIKRKVLYRVSQEERAKLREGVPYVELYRYNPKHLYPKLNGYGDNGKRSLKL